LATTRTTTTKYLVIYYKDGRGKPYTLGVLLSRFYQLP